MKGVKKKFRRTFVFLWIILFFDVEVCMVFSAMRAQVDVIPFHILGGGCLEIHDLISRRGGDFTRINCHVSLRSRDLVLLRRAVGDE